MVSNHNQLQGKAGEAEAKRYLLGLGYQILAENFHTRFGEIDLVALKKRRLVFVEVKWRRHQKFGDPLLAITPTKILHLKKAAYVFLGENPRYKTGFTFHFAAIAVRPYLPERELELVLLPPESGVLTE